MTMGGGWLRVRHVGESVVAGGREHLAKERQQCGGLQVRRVDGKSAEKGASEERSGRYRCVGNRRDGKPETAMSLGDR
jgi:hypothetical protein